MLMRASQSQLLLIDIQEKLLPVMATRDEVRGNARKLILAAQRFKTPVIVTEQYPKGIGHTDAALLGILNSNAKIYEKMAFSAFQAEAIQVEIETNRLQGRGRIVISGVEAHVCVLQTAFDLLAAGFKVFCVADAMASRTEASKTTALARLAQAGAQIVTTEMVVFEWLGSAGTADFKALLPLIK